MPLDDLNEGRRLRDRGEEKIDYKKMGGGKAFFAGGKRASISKLGKRKKAVVRNFEDEHQQTAANLTEAHIVWQKAKVKEEASKEVGKEVIRIGTLNVQMIHRPDKIEVSYYSNMVRNVLDYYLLNALINH